MNIGNWEKLIKESYIPGELLSTKPNQGIWDLKKLIAIKENIPVAGCQDE